MAKSELVKYGVIGVLVFACLFAVTRIFKGIGKFFAEINPINIGGNIISSITETDADKEKKKSVEETLNSKSSQSQAIRNLSEDDCKMIADNIKYALIGSITEDEDLLLSEIRKIQNQGDFDCVNSKYGCVKNHWWEQNQTMIQHIRDLIHGSELQEIEDWFKKHNITY